MNNKRNLMKTIKAWSAFILTTLLVVMLFGIIFITLDIVELSAKFFIELGIIVALTFIMRVFWYDFTEDRRLSEQDIVDEKTNYFKIVDFVVTDSNDLDKYLVLLNKENREHYINNKIGVRTPKNMAIKNKWIIFWHPSYKNLTAEEIGELRYNKLYFRIQRKADKIRPIKSEELLALSDSEYLYDTKNYRKSNKRHYQISSTLLSVVFTVALAAIAFDEIALNWANVFRYVSYLFSLATTIVLTIIKAYRTTGEDTFDWFSRLKHIIDKYACHKETNKEVSQNGIDNSYSNELSTVAERLPSEISGRGDMGTVV